MRGIAIGFWPTFLLISMCAPALVHAQTLRNFGDDPFLQISRAIADCPEPAGPRITEAEWRREAHHRIEEGNHCYIEGRCRLSNAYRYDREIAESLQRRLATLAAPADKAADAARKPDWRAASLWLMVRGRWVTVQGCVPPGFDTPRFLNALRAVADVEKVIDQTTANPARGVPYIRYAASTPEAPHR